MNAKLRYLNWFLVILFRSLLMAANYSQCIAATKKHLQLYEKHLITSSP
jgi:hypothetical protein